MKRLENKKERKNYKKVHFLTNSKADCQYPPDLLIKREDKKERNTEWLII